MSWNHSLFSQIHPLLTSNQTYNQYQNCLLCGNSHTTRRLFAWHDNQNSIDFFFLFYFFAKNRNIFFLLTKFSILFPKKSPVFFFISPYFFRIFFAKNRNIFVFFSYEFSIFSDFFFFFISRYFFLNLVIFFGFLGHSRIFQLCAHFFPSFILSLICKYRK